LMFSYQNAFMCRTSNAICKQTIPSLSFASPFLWFHSFSLIYYKFQMFVEAEAIQRNSCSIPLAILDVFLLNFLLVFTSVIKFWCFV
jgi:hypothetical protein